MGVSHVTITVNAVDPDIGAKIYRWVRDGEEVLLGLDDYSADEQRVYVATRNPAVLSLLHETFEREWERASDLADEENG